MSELITKELLSEILECRVLEIHGLFGNELQAELKHQDSTYAVNIHELAHDCKDWAIDLGYGIMTSENQDGVSVKLFSPDSLVKEFPPIDSKKYIFNYCQWIYENNLKKSA